MTDQTATMDPVTLLQTRFDPSSAAAFQRELHLIDHDGEAWTMATDGRQLLALPGTHGGAMPTTMSLAASLPWKLMPQGTPTTVEAIRALCQMTPVEPPKRVPSTCPECSGKKYTECICDCGDVHDAECEECDGTGIVGDDLPADVFELGGQFWKGIPKDSSAAWIDFAGKSVDVHVLFRAVFGLPDGPCTVESDPAVRYEMIRIVGDGWISIFMPGRV